VRAIAPGLTQLPRSIGSFADFRQSMLAAIRRWPALDGWRARDADDLGVMLLEFWAYVADIIAFYDEVAAHEAYLRTARRPESLTRLIGLLGYQPRPATAASALLALLAEGRDPVALPVGTAFRSAAFGAEAPQVFETEAEAEIHPLANRWTVRAPRLATLGEGGGLYTETHLFCERRGFDLEVGDLLLVDAPGHVPRPRLAEAITDEAAADGTPQKKLQLDTSVDFNNSRQVAKVTIEKATARIGLWTDDPIGASNRQIALERLQPGIRPGQHVVLAKEDDRRWFRVEANRTVDRIVRPQEVVSETVDGETISVLIPAVKTQVTLLVLDQGINAPGRRGDHPSWSFPDDADGITLHHGFAAAARVQGQPLMAILPVDPLDLEPGPRGLVALPPDPLVARRYLLEDAGGRAYAISGSIDAGRFQFEEAADWPEPLVPPLTIFGNVVDARRGETVRREVLGSGDRSVAGQAFKLKKAPHAFLPDTSGATTRGYRSAATIRVDGVAWTEIEDFVTAGPEDEVYVLRQAEDGATEAVFGDGVQGRRLPTGSGNVEADYRFGAGAAAPPARAITQLARPVKGVAGVTNPIAAGAGADAESPDEVRDNAPSVALLLGRIVSLDDVQAVAASFPGVTAARAEWRWNGVRQTAVVQVDCIAEEIALVGLREKIRNLSEPSLQVAVAAATAVPAAVALAIEIDPRHVADDVLAAVRARLMDAEDGLLAARNVGIGVPLFRSRLHAEVLAVAGTVAVTELLFDGAPFGGMGRHPGVGAWFDVAAGELVLNGEAGNGE
jgi:hypothetical protein